MTPMINASNRGLRIAVLADPQRPDDQEAVARLQAVGAAVGVSVFAVADGETDVEADMALALSVRGSKPVDLPTYVIVSGGLRAFADSIRFRDLLTYDGYLTLSDGVASWLRHVMFGTRKLAAPITRFGLTPPVGSEVLPVIQAPALAFVGRSGVCPLRDGVLTLLAARPYLRLYGADWAEKVPSRAFGSLPGGGQALAAAYRAAGVGLCLEPAVLRMDGGLSPRLFDIVGAGVPCICARSPDVEAMFGESLLYVDADAPIDSMAWQINQQMEWIAGNSDAALDMARRASAVFRETWTLNTLFANLLALHAEMEALRRIWRDASTGTAVSIAVLGEAGPETASRFAATFAALAKQQGGMCEVLAVTWGEGPIPSDGPPGVTWRHQPEGKRCDALWAALEWLRQRPGYFCILDAGSRPASDHFSSLLAALRKVDGRFWPGRVRLAYAGARREAPLSPSQSVYFQFFSTDQLGNTSWCEAAPGFLAETALIDEEILENPALADGEDLYLWLLLAERTAFAFSAQLTLTVPAPRGKKTEISAASLERITMRLFSHTARGSIGYSLEICRTDGTTFKINRDHSLNIPAYWVQSDGLEAPTRLIRGWDPISWPATVMQDQGAPVGIFHLSAFFSHNWAKNALFVRLESLVDDRARTIEVPVRQRPFGNGMRLDGEFENSARIRGPVRLVIHSGDDIPLEPPVAIDLWRVNRPLIFRLGDLMEYSAVWLYGGSAGGRIVLRRMAEAGLPRPAGVIDSFLTGDLDGLPIQRLADVRPNLNERTAVLIASQYWKSIYASLKAESVQNVFSAFPFNRDLIYSLDEVA